MAVDLVQLHAFIPIQSDKTMGWEFNLGRKQPEWHTQEGWTVIPLGMAISWISFSQNARIKGSIDYVALMLFIKLSL